MSQFSIGLPALIIEVGMTNCTIYGPLAQVPGSWTTRKILRVGRLEVVQMARGGQVTYYGAVEFPDLGSQF